MEDAEAGVGLLSPDKVCLVPVWVTNAKPYSKGRKDKLRGIEDKVGVKFPSKHHYIPKKHSVIQHGHVNFGGKPAAETLRHPKPLPHSLPTFRAQGQIVGKPKVPQLRRLLRLQEVGEDPVYMHFETHVSSQQLGARGEEHKRPNPRKSSFTFRRTCSALNFFGASYDALVAAVIRKYALAAFFN